MSLHLALIALAALLATSPSRRSRNQTIVVTSTEAERGRKQAEVTVRP